MAKLCKEFANDLNPQIQHIESEGLHEYAMALSKALYKNKIHKTRTLHKKVQYITNPLCGIKRIFNRLINKKQKKN